jgi:hypothetical protein
MWLLQMHKTNHQHIQKSQKALWFLKNTNTLEEKYNFKKSSSHTAKFKTQILFHYGKMY